MTRPILITASLLFIAVFCACPPEHTADCTRNIECLYTNEAVPGLCISDGQTGCYCAFPTHVCPSGYKWFSNAPESLARKCVLPSLLLPDAGTTTCGTIADAGTD